MYTKVATRQPLGNRYHRGWGQQSAAVGPSARDALCRVVPEPDRYPQTNYNAYFIATTGKRKPQLSYKGPYGSIKALDVSGCSMAVLHGAQVGLCFIFLFFRVE